MYTYYIFMIEENIEYIKAILAKLHNNYKLICVDKKKIESFYEKRPLSRFFSDDWKIYRILNSPFNLNYVKFEYSLFPSEYPDDCFGEVLIELSKIADKEIYYFWQQHIDIGFEVYKNGQCLNSVIVDTHGPGIKVDGKPIKFEKPIKSKKSKKPFFSQIFEKQNIWYLEEYSKFPPQILELVSKAKFGKFPWEYIGEFAVFIKKDISDIDSLIDNMNMNLIPPGEKIKIREGGKTIVIKGE